MTAREEAQALVLAVFPRHARDARIVDSGDALCLYCGRRRVVANQLCGRRNCIVHYNKLLVIHALSK